MGKINLEDTVKVGKLFSGDGLVVFFPVVRGF